MAVYCMLPPVWRVYWRLCLPKMASSAVCTAGDVFNMQPGFMTYHVECAGRSHPCAIVITVWPIKMEKRQPKSQLAVLDARGSLAHPSCGCLRHTRTVGSVGGVTRIHRARSACTLGLNTGRSWCREVNMAVGVPPALARAKPLSARTRLLPLKMIHRPW